VRSADISGRPVFSAQKTSQQSEIFPEPTGWPRVDRQMGELRLRLREASNEEQFQSVGHLCREVLISAAQALYDPNRHPPVDGVSPSPTDAKRMLGGLSRRRAGDTGSSSVLGATPLRESAAVANVNLALFSRLASLTDLSMNA
jgi:hypothetical protein